MQKNKQEHPRTRPATGRLPAPEIGASGSKKVLRPNFITRRAYSNILALVRNKHPPAPPHDGKGLGEVIDFRSGDGAPHCWLDRDPRSVSACRSRPVSALARGAKNPIRSNRRGNERADAERLVGAPSVGILLELVRQGWRKSERSN